MHNSTQRIGGAERTVPVEAGKTFIDEPALPINFTRIKRGVKEVVVKAGNEIHHVQGGCLEVTELVNRGIGSMADKWPYSQVEYVVRRGPVIIYASSHTLERALRIASGEEETSKTWAIQDVTWYNGRAEPYFARLFFINMAPHRSVPPARWFLHRPEGFTFDRRNLPCESVASGVVTFFVNGRLVFGRLAREYGSNAFSVSETTLLVETARDWAESGGWSPYDDAGFSRTYSDGRTHFVSMPALAPRVSGLIPALFQHSGSVVLEPGHTIRVRYA